MKKRNIAPYLRALRRRSSLSQENVAFLLGAFGATRVSRHETGECVPPLAVVLAYEIIFAVAVGEIYEHDFTEIRAVLGERAKELHDSLLDRKTDMRRHEKRRTLQSIINRCANNPNA
jgi:DNA-binding XRE family transcriptional regulator